jgi:endonuclease/exonuclease/phosphatase family metal-dependent hydrolase
VAILLAVTAVAGACVQARTAPRPKGVRDLTVLTYNMQQGSHLNGNRNYSRQLELIRSLNPDIIGLQESDTVRPSGGCVDAVRFFAESLGYYAYYGPGALAGTFGTAILSRYPIRNALTFFTYSDSDEVGTALGEIDVNGKTVAFFSSHPSGGESVMNAHVNSLKSEAGKYEYVIAVGDYNFTRRAPFFASLSELLHEERGDDHGLGAKADDEIDHIFLSRKVHALERHYISPAASETDHPAHCDVLTMDN